MKKRTNQTNETNQPASQSGNGPAIPTNEGRPYICKYDEIPVDHFFLRSNPASFYIRSGYRINHKTVRDVLESFWKWHNETVNIHTHFWAIFIFVLLAIRTFFFLPLFAAYGEFSDGVIYLVGISSAAFCFTCSTIYHLFNCKSEISYKVSEKIDFGGILVYLGCGLLGCFYYGFWCLPEHRQFYSWLAGLLSVVVFPVVLFSQKRSTRTFCFLCIVAVGVFACFHWIYMVGLYAPDVIELFPYVLIMWTFMGVAFFFYLSKIPERFFPGRVDIIGASHQLWHIFIALGALWQYHFLLHVFEYRKTVPCPY